MLGTCLIIQYLCSLGREGWLLCFCGLLNEMFCCLSLPLPKGTVGIVVCDCRICRSYSLTIFSLELTTNNIINWLLK